MAEKMQSGVGAGPGAEIPREQQFVHLHLHTEYSLLDGGNRIDRLVARVAKLGMKAVGVTDHGNIFGAVAFYQTCKEKGVKPILGVEAYVTPPDKPRTDRTYSGGGEGGYHLVLLAQDLVGWRNLLVLCSEAYLTGFYYKPRIDRALLEKHSEGLIAINGHLGSEIGEHLLEFASTNDRKYWDRAVESAVWHDRVFNQRRRDEETKRRSDAPASGTSSLSLSVSASLPRFYIELQKHVPEQNRINPLLVKLARELKLPIVCDNDAHFLKEEDHDAHDTLICISTGKNKDEPGRMRYSPELYVKSPAQMRALADDEIPEVRAAWAEACDNAVEIAERCNVELPIGQSHAPMVRVDIPEAKGLPRWDDPAYGGDLTAWYKDYCARFIVRPFRQQPTAEELVAARGECDRALRMLAEAGVVWRYGPGGRDEEAKRQRDEVAARLERELKILADKNISAYFLIVWDFVNWGRQRGIPALARGSGVGTMAGYVLGLSNACPVRYGLLFERFTDPDRSEYPDIDIDLCQDGRGNVINYVREKYGHVAQIITFGTLKARAALRDVARVLGVSLPAADRIAKLVPEQLNITIDEALEQEPDFKGLYEGRAASLAKVNDKLGFEQQVTPEQARRLIDNARTLEGQARHASVHAAGVIVATRPLNEIVPLYKQAGAEEHEVVTQWDGPTCEKMGLLKMDFLGLRTISVIERAKKLIRETLSEEDIWKAVGRSAEFAEQGSRAQSGEGSKGKKGSRHADVSTPRHLSHPLDLERLTFDDQRVFEMFRRGDTTGVFQFESGGMRRLLVEMKPDRLEDLIAANALFRPGPMDLIPDYNRRKHGQDAVPTVHEIVDRYTAETYGVMVYQEQVMQIVHGLGGIKLRDAYSLIKNISKKKHDKIEKERPKFVEGSQKQGLTRQQAEELFELILKFAGYGFNKSHSTGYAIVAYQTAYLKTYFPNQYMAAFLTYESAASAVSDWTPYLEDCRRARFIDPGTGQCVKVGVEVRPPDINLSGPEFSVVFDAQERPGLRAHQGHVRFGLKAIKGAGEKAIEEIIKERSDGVTESRSDAAGSPRAELRHSVTASLRHFTSLFDFCERVLARGPGVLNKATIESLIKCGAFDALHGRENRAAMSASIEQAVSSAQKAAADKASGQGALFGLGAGPGPAPSSADSGGLLAKATPWGEAETLAKEKEALGFYVSSHPLERWRAWASVFTTSTITTAKEAAQDSRVVLAAMVQSVRTLIVKSGRSAGQKMAVITIEDLTGSMDSVMFSDCFARFGHLCEAEKVVFVLGRLDRSRGDAQVLIERLVPIEGVPLQPGRLQLCLDEPRLNGNGPATLAKVAGLIRAASGAETPAEALVGAATGGVNGHANGGTNGHANGHSNGNGVVVGAMAKADAPTPFPVEVVIATATHAAVLTADHRLRVMLQPELIKDLESALGPGMVRLVGGVSVELNQQKPWQKRRGGGDEE